MSSSFIATTVVPVLYLLSAILFILGLKGLTRVRSAQRGNAMSALAMLIAAVAALVEMGTFDLQWIVLGLVIGGGIGALAAVRVEMTGMPEMVALFNGSGGAASALVAASYVWLNVIEKSSGETAANTAGVGSASAVTAVLSMFIGALTLSGSVVAYGKLAGKISGSPILLPGRHVVNLSLILGALGLGAYTLFTVTDPGSIAMYTLVVMGLSLVLGIMLVIPIGGADMPVVISLLNSYSGLAAAATGFVLQNNVLVISGALVGASGLILTQIMCVAMNRTLANVLFGGFGTADSGGGSEDNRDYTNVRSGGPEEAALVLENAESVVIVPGYGLAVAQAQHTVKEFASELEKRGVKVTYGIHPVAGRMPGHMNVLLAEADVPYEQLLEMDVVNPEFNNTDVVVVVGANDVVNPAAEKTPGSPIYGMPVLQVWNAASVIMIKRSLSPGFAGIKNELFEYDNTMMLFEDGKKAVQGMLTELKSL